MVVRVYISGISGSKEVKKRQQRVTMILDSKNIKYDLIDITEPGKESEKEFMQENSKARDSKHPLPPQIFNDDHYCGDYEEFDMANELDELEKFLNMSSNEANKTISENGVLNGSSEFAKDDSFTVKEDLRESTEENLDIINDNVTEAVSLDDSVESVPIQTHQLLDEHESIKNENTDVEEKSEESTDATSAEE